MVQWASQHQRSAEHCIASQMSFFCTLWRQCESFAQTLALYQAGFLGERAKIMCTKHKRVAHSIFVLAKHQIIDGKKQCLFIGDRAEVAVPWRPFLFCCVQAVRHLRWRAVVCFHQSSLSRTAVYALTVAFTCLFVLAEHTCVLPNIPLPVLRTFWLSAKNNLHSSKN